MNTSSEQNNTDSGRVTESTRHNLISTNLHIAIGELIAASRYGYFSSNMKMQSHTSNRKYHLCDGVLCCIDLIDQDIICEPLSIIEILSDKSSVEDKGFKLTDYLKNDSLYEYILISQDEMKVSIYRKHAQAIIFEEFYKGDDLVLASVGLKLSVNRIYSKVFD